MTVESWVAIGVGVCGILSSIFMALRWVIKSYLIELKPNSGSSLKDAVLRLEQQTSRLEKRVDDLFVLITKS